MVLMLIFLIEMLYRNGKYKRLASIFSGMMATMQCDDERLSLYTVVMQTQSIIFTIILRNYPLERKKIHSTIHFLYNNHPTAVAN